MSGWKADAELFGKAGSKAFLAMLAARCVEASTGQGRRLPATSAKVSPGAFAAAAGKSRGTVNRYLAAWDLLADAGHVPPREDLIPGVDVELPSPKTWTHYYRLANPPKARTPIVVTPQPSLQVEALVTRMFDMADATEERLPGPVGQAFGLLVDAIADLRHPAHTEDAFLRSVDAVAELVAALETP